MTNKFDYQIEILQAAKEGKPLQSRRRNSSKQEWMDGVTISKEGVLFDFTNYEFRVKKEPDVIYSVSCKRGGDWILCSNHFSKKSAERAALLPQEAGYPVRIRKFVEVLEGED